MFGRFDKMHCWKHVLIAIFVQVTVIESANNVTTTLFDIVHKECPDVDIGIKSQDVFQKCANWTKVMSEGSRNLTLGTSESYLCALFYESFVSFCTQLKVSSAKLSEPIELFQLNAVCKNNNTFPINAIVFRKVIDLFKTSETMCKFLCRNRDSDVANPICSAAHYYSNHHVMEKEPSALKHDTSPGVHGSDTKQSKTAHAQLEGSSTGVPKLGKNEVITTDHEDRSIRNGQLQPVEMTNEENNQNINIENEKTTQVSLEKPSSESVPAVQKSNLLITSFNTHPNSQTITNTPAQSNVNTKKTEIKPTATESSADQSQEFDDPPVDQVDGGDLVGMDKNDNTDIKEDSKVETLDVSKPDSVDSFNYNSEMDGNSYFFSYFIVVCILFIVAYVGYHNKQKIFALLLEGRLNKKQNRTTRRPNSANYHKLDSNLEEAISSSCSKNTSNIIY